MPELPDVEGYRTTLSAHLPGWRVRDVTVPDAGVLRNATAQAFRERLIGHRFQQPDRRGKWLLLPTDGPILLVHNGMTGRPYLVSSSAEAGSQPSSDPYDRLIISCDQGELRYADLRKLRGVWIVDSDTEVEAVIGAQGPDALGLSRSAFQAALRGRRGTVKTVLMNQSVIAGLGNMLSDEICWRAHLHPACSITALDEVQLDRLSRVTQQTLRAAVRQGRIPRTRAWLSSTRDREPAPCPRCDTTLRRSTIGGRTSIWCPHCQPPPTSQT